MATKISEIELLEGAEPFSAYMGRRVSSYYAQRAFLADVGFSLAHESDFLTAPHICQVFGEICGLFLAYYCSQLGAGGSPDMWHWVELGPGKGVLMHDMVRAVRQACPSIYEKMCLHLVEGSPQLRRAQKQKLADMDVPIYWHDDLSSLPDAALFVVANEFFDALPIDQLIFHNGAWRQVYYVAPAQQLVLGPCIVDEGVLQAYLPERGSPQEGEVLEVSKSRLEVMRGLCQRIQSRGGCALIIDYGYREKSFGDTLQAIKENTFSDILDSQSDLSSHVAFAPLLSVAENCGLETCGPVTQKAFLESMGLRERVEGLKKRCDPTLASQLDRQCGRLIGSGPRSMGEMFQCLTVYNRLP